MEMLALEAAELPSASVRPINYQRNAPHLIGGLAR